MIRVQRQFLDRVKNVYPTHPVIDTCTLELHELKIVKFISTLLYFKSAYTVLTIDTAETRFKVIP